LIPPAPDDPAPSRIRGRVFGDLRLRFRERIRVRQVQRDRREAETHDVAMRIDHAGNDEAAIAVDLEVDVARALVAAVEHVLDAPVVANHQAGEVIDLAVLVDRDALDVVDQRVGCGRGAPAAGGKGEGGGGKTDHAGIPLSRAGRETRMGGQLGQVGAKANVRARTRNKPRFLPPGFALGRLAMNQTQSVSAAESAAQNLTIDDVRAAAERIKGAVVRTPTMYSQTLSEI